LVEAGGRLTDAIRAGVTISHPTEPDLGFLYGTILTDDAPCGEETWNLCVFAERQVDRSPTGSGVSARMALDHARGLTGMGQSRIFRGISGEPFSGTVTRRASGQDALHVEVGGRAFYTGRGTFVVEAGDPLGWGFDLAPGFGAARDGR
jgi:trans-L-3-hydroxyproline dehydratase